VPLLILASVGVIASDATPFGITLILTGTLIDALRTGRDYGVADRGRCQVAFAVNANDLRTGGHPVELHRLA
jgi:hypothetical protein